MPLRLQVQFRSLERVADGIANAERTLVNNQVLASAGSRILLKAVKDEAPRGRRFSGDSRPHAADSIVAKGGGNKRGIYGWHGFADYVIPGTPPHVIRARQAHALAFFWPSYQGSRPGPGDFVFFKAVNHPGTKANDFVRRAVDKATPALRVLLLENGRQLIQLIKEG